MPIPPEYVSKIEPYQPGMPVEELERELGITNSVKLASNENPVGPSPMAVQALAAPASTLNRYPDGGCFYLRKRLAAGLGVGEDELIFGNGSNELIEIAVRTFMRPGDEAVMAHPTFVVYAMAAGVHGCTAVEVPLKDDAHDLTAMAEAINDKTKMVFIANPNNPTGTIKTKQEFGEFMGRVPEGVLVVMDEAYFEYVTRDDYADSVEYLRAGREILILRTFSKIYGLAGLRIGYGITSAGVAADMNRVREPFNTNSLAQCAALAALGDTAHLQRSRRLNEEGKHYLYRELEALGVDFVPTEANFIFMRVSDAPAMYGALLKEGVIIRPMGPGGAGGAGAVRATIGLPEENERFVKALGAYLKEQRT